MLKQELHIDIEETKVKRLKTGKKPEFFEVGIEVFNFKMAGELQDAVVESTTAAGNGSENGTDPVFFRTHENVTNERHIHNTLCDNIPNRSEWELFSCICCYAK